MYCTNIYIYISVCKIAYVYVYMYICIHIHTLQYNVIALHYIHAYIIHTYIHTYIAESDTFAQHRHANCGSQVLRDPLSVEDTDVKRRDHATRL